MSHTMYYDGYDIAEVLTLLEPLPITGFHLSDAIRGKDLRDSTHLPIGQGDVDFRSPLALFDGNDAVYGALEVRGPASGISDTLAHLQSVRNLS